MANSQNMVKFFYGWILKDYKIRLNGKIKNFIDVIIIITIYNSFTYLFLNEIF
jgi:hypothetical protein